jgi:hypothetical protein
MSHAFLTENLALEATVFASRPGGAAMGVTPTEVREFLARLRLLEGVPFSHLIADAELLPPESIRFFYVDREWTDALVEGALSVGTITTLDREQLQAVYAAIRGDVDAQERRVRAEEPGAIGSGAANTITGFLLRSAAVSGWPGLHVRAYREEVPDAAILPDTDPRRLSLLRVERLAPAVLLVLFDGVPRLVHVEEPRQGIQFGVDLVDGTTIRPRDVKTAQRLENQARVPVPFRAGAPGVVHFARLAADLAAIPATRVVVGGDTEVGSAGLAMQLLQFPYRQVFGPELQPAAQPATIDAYFAPTVRMAEIRRWYGGDNG